MSSTHLKYQTFAITFRPKGGVVDHGIHAFAEYAKKKCLYYKVITEKEGHERHIHAAFYMKEPMYRFNLQKSLLRLFPELSSEETLVFKQGIKVSGTISWLDYLEKGDCTEIVCTNLPERNHLEAYYPSKEDGPQHVRKNLSYYGRLEKLWYEHVPPGVVPNPINVRHFLFNMMYSMRLIDVIKDDRTIIQVSRHLARFINKVTESTIERMVENDFNEDL